MYLLDASVVSELRRHHPHPTVVRWVRQVDAEELVLCAVTVGRIEAGIEFTREQDVAKAEEPEARLGPALVSYNILAMNAAVFREWARPGHRRPDTLIEHGMIAATAVVHRPTAATWSVRELDQCGFRRMPSTLE